MQAVLVAQVLIRLVGTAAHRAQMAAMAVVVATAAAVEPVLLVAEQAGVGVKAARSCRASVGQGAGGPGAGGAGMRGALRGAKVQSSLPASLVAALSMGGESRTTAVVLEATAEAEAAAGVGTPSRPKGVA